MARGMLGAINSALSVYQNVNGPAFAIGDVVAGLIEVDMTADWVAVNRINMRLDFRTAESVRDS